MSSVALTVDQKAMFSELGLERNAADAKDTKQLITILTQYLKYPSDRLAGIHREACRLGSFDEIQKRKQMKNQFMATGSSFSICECCCCIQQGQLNFTTQIQNIETLSESVILFFSDIKYIAVWCLISFCIFGIFGIATNILAFSYDSSNNIDECLRSRCILHMISLGAKLQPDGIQKVDTLYQIEAWMRIILVLIWTVFFVLKLKTQKSISIEQQLRNVTASDFAILIHKLPMEYDKQTLQRKLDTYANDVSHTFKGRFLQKGDSYDMKLTIVDFNEAQPYYEIVHAYDEHQQSSSEQFLKQRKGFLKQWICFRQNNKEFPISEEQRQTVYCEIDAKNLQMIQELRSLEQFVHEEMKKTQMKNETRPVIITFHHNYAKQNMLSLNHLPWYSKIFKCFRDIPYTLDIPNIVVEQAPEPEDIIWQNIGTPLRTVICRTLLTYLSTILLLLLSCIVLYILSIIQSFTDGWYMSIIISTFISLFNLIILQIIYQLSYYEKNTTNTNFQISVAHKAILAQLINSVVINIFINMMTKKNFGKGGLAEDVFFLSVTSALLPPLTRAIGFGDAWRYAKRWWSSIPRNKIGFEHQREYNLIWEKSNYEIGYNYVYTIKTIIFAAFFLSLQPIIALISCIGLIMMYYAEKYILFYRSNRPKPRYTYINTEMNALMRLSILSFALGNLFFNHFIPESYHEPKKDYQDIANVVIGIIIYFIPLTLILQKYEQIPDPVGLKYENQKIFLLSEYERINPLTREEGIKNFGAYISDLKLKYQNNKKNFIEMISYVIDENKGNPIETVCKMKASIRAHQGERRRRKNSTFSGISEEPPKSRILEAQSEVMSEKSSVSPSISLIEPGNQYQVPLQEAIKLQSLRESSVNNSLLNDLIKPKQAQKQIPFKNPMLRLISSIMQLQDDDDLKITKPQSSLQKMQSINKFVEQFKPHNLPFMRKLSKS